MAYCVHCGVKLSEGAWRCPLCNTLVIDPSDPDQKERKVVPPYPVHTPEQVLTMNRKYLARLILLVLVIPAILCLVVNLLLDGKISWSVYPSVALVLLAIGVLVPLLVKKGRLYISIIINFFILSAYLFLVERLSESGNWFFPVVLPSLALGVVIILLITLLFNHDRLNKLTVIASALIGCALECAMIELMCTLSIGGAASFVWSPYVLAPCIFSGTILFFINGNRYIREEFRRKMHF